MRPPRLPVHPEGGTAARGRGRLRGCFTIGAASRPPLSHIETARPRHRASARCGKATAGCAVEKSDERHYRSAAADVAKRPVTQRTLSVFKLESPMKVFTTGQVAKICKVAPRTVSKWFDSGRLKGYRIPGSQDRRIPREYLIKFLKEHGMPLGDLEDEAMAKVLIVAQDQVLIENLKRELPVERAFRTSTAASGFEAGIQAESFHPDCINVFIGSPWTAHDRVAPASSFVSTTRKLLPPIGMNTPNRTR